MSQPEGDIDNSFKNGLTQDGVNFIVNTLELTVLC